MRSRELMDRARERTGLADFGDPGFAEGLERLGTLLVGIGLPRTGSTALACLLGADPDARSLRTWESQQPCPPPETASYARDPRIAATEAMMARRAALFPRMTAMLPTTATSPTECQTFMAYDFKSQLFQGLAHVPSYAAWLNGDADLVPTYRYLERVLKLLQWRCPTRAWRIKNPSHSLFVDAFDAVFPQARFVMTHRAVEHVLPSLCDVYYELSRAYSDRVDPLWIGAVNTDWCELAMRRTIRFRDAGADPRFFDIGFAALQSDPLATMAALYDWLGEELTPAAAAAMAEWRRTTPRDAGYPRSDPALFGLDGPALADRFRFYSDRFPTVAADRMERAT